MALQTHDFSGLPMTVASSGPLADIFTTAGLSAALGAQLTSVSATPSASPSTPGSGGSLYCQTCNKSFGSEATYATHQKTARHLTTLKEQQRKRDGVSANVKGKPKKTPVSAEASEAARQVLYADSLTKTDLAGAATVYWAASNTLWSQSRIRETADCLSKLIAVLSHLQTQPSAGEPAVTPPATVLKPSQIVETLYLARMALARLTSSYDCDVALALYMDALEGKYSITDMLTDAISEGMPFPSVLSRCHANLEDKIKPTLKKPPRRATAGPAVDDSAKNAADAKNSVALRKLQLVVTEVLTFAASVEALSHAVLLGGVAVAVAEDGQRYTEMRDILVRLADIYASFDRPWSACDCLESAAGAAGIEASRKTEAPFQFGEQANSVESQRSDPPSETSLLCDALMLAMAVDDRVRMDRLAARVMEMEPDYRDDPDLNFIISLTRASCTLDRDWETLESRYQYDDLAYRKSAHHPSAASRDKLSDVWRAWRKGRT
ncbi:hypothetical protein HKX48_002265 [Thoreauomyces humboldtii]|nr:hypothetical protein HKX48_002265 [Thoreauomyces humboldtii]